MSSSSAPWIVLLISVGGCSVITPCQTDDLEFRATPASASVKVGEKFTAGAEFLGCRGGTSLADEIRWSSQDTTVVRVGATTGEVMAVGAGTTTVIATGTKYGAGPRIAVTVRP
jgi:hypothetical protein